MVELWVPLPPSANRLWRVARGRVIKSQEYTSWLREASIEAGFKHIDGVAGLYKISITAAKPDKRRRDLDNLIKPLSDLCANIGAIEDDRYCQRLEAEWVSSGDGVAIRIEPWEAK